MKNNAFKNYNFLERIIHLANLFYYEELQLKIVFNWSAMNSISKLKNFTI